MREARVESQVGHAGGGGKEKKGIRFPLCHARLRGRYDDGPGVSADFLEMGESCRATVGDQQHNGDGRRSHG